jgi:hypothetical protein
MVMSNSYEGFVKRLLGSQGAVFCVGQWLNSSGWDIQIPALKVAKKHDNRADFFDNGDLFRRKGDQPWERIEVKGSGYDFTDRASWRYDQMIVSNKDAVERGVGEVKAYVILSKNWEWVAIIKTETKDHWSVKSLHASNTDKWEDFYLCPADKVIFHKMKDRGSS